jgi:PknH-like extracellular domain
VVLAGCTGVTSGHGVPVSDTAVTTTPSRGLVSAQGIADNRLKRSELASIVGESDLRQVQSYTAPYDSSEGVEPRECAYTLLFQETLAYLGALAIVGDGNRGARGQAVSQLITVFDDREQSERVVADAPEVWEKCPAGAPFSTTVGAATQHWVRGQTTSAPTGRPPLSSARRRRRGAAGMWSPAGPTSPSRRPCAATATASTKPMTSSPASWPHCRASGRLARSSVGLTHGFSC